MEPQVQNSPPKRRTHPKRVGPCILKRRLTPSPGPQACLQGCKVYLQTPKDQICSLFSRHIVTYDDGRVPSNNGRIPADQHKKDGTAEVAAEADFPYSGRVPLVRYLRVERLGSVENASLTRIDSPSSRLVMRAPSHCPPSWSSAPEGSRRRLYFSPLPISPLAFPPFTSFFLSFPFSSPPSPLSRPLFHLCRQLEPVRRQALISASRALYNTHTPHLTLAPQRAHCHRPASPVCLSASGISLGAFGARRQRLSASHASISPGTLSAAHCQSYISCLLVLFDLLALHTIYSAALLSHRTSLTFPPPPLHLSITSYPALSHCTPSA
ncbi:hypothetical protein BD626DRAFT_483341 [Schizophyllum amplum]|uniref:Uncharacterized protein n=1 Tax=Schizophyllum amplum TaxID=97359 RepID=A0A550CPE3_9AGAR|nr:hypothetical protein BD626DRAFT_483341 [Auriculariopsis ampla]